jgi:hypothetical protein
MYGLKAVPFEQRRFSDLYTTVRYGLKAVPFKQSEIFRFITQPLGMG